MAETDNYMDKNPKAALADILNIRAIREHPVFVKFYKDKQKKEAKLARRQGLVPVVPPGKAAQAGKPAGVAVVQA